MINCIFFGVYYGWTDGIFACYILHNCATRSEILYTQKFYIKSVYVGEEVKIIVARL